MENEQAFFVNRPWSWRERLKFKLFPVRPCHLPETHEPNKFTDVLFVRTVVVLDWRDRLRLLFRGKLLIDQRVLTEHPCGNTLPSSSAYPIWSIDDAST